VEKRQFKRNASATTVTILNKSKFSKTKITYPISLEEQKKIVQAIETQFTRLDEAIKSLKSVKKKLEIYRKAVLKKAFEKKEDWEEDSLEKVCEKIKQIVPQKEKFDNFTYIDIGCINNRLKSIENPKKIESFNAPSRARQESKEGDVVFSTVRTYLKNMAVIPKISGKIISSTGFVVLRSKKDKLDSKWIFYTLQTDKLITDINKKQVGTSYPAIRKKDLLNYKINYPSSLTLQQKIVSDIESKFSIIDKVEEVVNNSLKKSEQLRKSILKKAFEGELVKPLEVKR
jgi:type I restriction enzyme S subunit